MEFTYKEYEKLIGVLKKSGYTICGYENYLLYEKPVILRHDVDMSIEKAFEMALIEYGMGVKSTYYVLISSDFYNVYSKYNIERLRKMQLMGHTIGLHFDEERWEDNILKAIEKEVDILEKMLEKEVVSVSMHRPSDITLKSNYEIKAGRVINSYSKTFFEEFKYVSDSRRNWREDIFKIIESGQYNRLHILTHPMWYAQNEKGAKETLSEFCKNKVYECYDILDANIRDLSQILQKEELER